MTERYCFLQLRVNFCFFFNLCSRFWVERVFGSLTSDRKSAVVDTFERSIFEIIFLANNDLGKPDRKSRKTNTEQRF